MYLVVINYGPGEIFSHHAPYTLAELSEMSAYHWLNGREVTIIKIDKHLTATLPKE